MTSTLPDILGRIVFRKQEELAGARLPLAHLKAMAATQTRRDFAAALRSRKPAIIAEIKKASPSKGILGS